MSVAVFLIILFAKYGDIKKKAEKGFGFMAAGGLMFFVAATFSNLEVWTPILADNAIYATYIFEIVGWIFVIVGVIYSTVDLAQR
jgi:hypothetical protein